MLLHSSRWLAVQDSPDGLFLNGSQRSSYCLLLRLPINLLKLDVQIHKAQDNASRRGKLTVEDIMFLIRKVSLKGIPVKYGGDKNKRR